jgi:hypothetical protein
MSNGLFVRSYPAIGVQIAPVTFRAGRLPYFLLILAPLVFVWYARHLILGNFTWIGLGLTIYALGAILAATFLRNLKLEIRADGICYTDIFRRATLIYFAEISTVVVNTNPHVRAVKLWFNPLLIGTIEITPKVETGKAPIKVSSTLFPHAAKEQLTQLLKPEQWDVQA